LSSSSSSCSPVSELKSLSKSNEAQLGKQKKFQWLGIYMVVLISLVFTIFWGKINAIILTSMIFCCFSLWNASSHLLKRVCKFSNTKSKAQKNRHCSL
jgi:4-hydroxybenzoate polyprenyltransferase